MIESDNQLYHPAQTEGYWTGKEEMRVGFDLFPIGMSALRPLEIRQRMNTLMIVMLRHTSGVEIDVNMIPGLQVVRGDSTQNPHEVDGELLIEFTYLKVDKLESKPRRIRPTGIYFGIMGDTEASSAAGSSHRAMGESADYYLVGVDTQYDPQQDGAGAVRHFPFWRMGVWGPQQEKAGEWLPEAPGNNS